MIKPKRHFTTCRNPVQISTFRSHEGQRLTTKNLALAGAGAVIVPSGSVNNLISVWQRGQGLEISLFFILRYPPSIHELLGQSPRNIPVYKNCHIVGDKQAMVLDTQHKGSITSKALLIMPPYAWLEEH